MEEKNKAGERVRRMVRPKVARKKYFKRTLRSQPLKTAKEGKESSGDEHHRINGEHNRQVPSR